MIVRPVTSADLPALIELARSTGTGLTTLPANEQRLQHRVSWAEKAFRVAEMRGMSDEEGRSPFWESLGRHFFKMEFSQADYLTGVGNKAFIAELMPKFPLYTCFLSEEARGVIGRVHPNTEPALAMLKAEGFSYQGYVDIFDAGPAIEAETDKIRAIAESQNLVLAVGTPGDDAEPYLIHNRKREDCRITAAPARAAAGTLVVDPLTAKRLRLSAGASVRAVPLSAQKRG